MTRVNRVTPSDFLKPVAVYVSTFSFASTFLFVWLGAPSGRCLTNLNCLPYFV